MNHRGSDYEDAPVRLGADAKGRPDVTSAASASAPAIAAAAGHEANLSTSSDSSNDVSALSSSSGERPLDTSATRRVLTGKKRPVTYYARKEETEALVEELQHLEQELGAIVAKRPRHRQELERSLAINALLSRDIKTIDHAMAAVRSMMSAYCAEGRNPLDSYIHLPVDPEERRERLLSLSTHKFRRAVDYILERRRFLDLHEDHRQTETFYRHGGCTVACFDVTVFRGVSSVREVYEEMRHFVNHQEMSVSERLGVITVREGDGDDDDGATVSQARLISTVAGHGLEVESNSAYLAEFVETSELLAEPHGILVRDYVDRDDQYPYESDKRVRKDVTAAALITATPDPRLGTQGMTVTMCRSSSVRLHKPRFPVSEDQMDRLRDDGGRWFDVMIKVIKERLAWRRATRNGASTRDNATSDLAL